MRTTVAWDGTLIGGELPSEQYKELAEAKAILNRILAYKRQCIERDMPIESVGLTFTEVTVLQRILCQYPENFRGAVGGVPIYTLTEGEKG